MSILISIGAGHYLGTPGKKCLKSIDKNETKEWVLNDRVADKVEKMLEQYDCQTMRVDDTTGQNGISLQDRVAAANNANADVAIAIHHNAGIKGGNGGGIVIYQRPNATQKEKVLQEAVYRHTVNTTGLKGNRANPLAEANLYAVNKTKMTAILCELGFMDSQTDTPIILTEEFAKNAAQGIVNALVEVYKIKLKEEIDMTKDEVVKLVDEKVNSAVETLKKDLSPVVYKTANDIPDWAIDTVDKLVAEGKLKGDEHGDLNISQDLLRALVIMNR